MLFFASSRPASFPVCCNYNESHDATKINEPVGASPSNNLKSWNNEISTKSRCTIQIQEQTKPKQNKASIFEGRSTQTAVVPFNNIQSAIFSVPVCYSERSSKYLERRRGDETGIEQWDFGCVMAFVHLAPPALCSVCCAVSSSPVGPPLVLSPGGVSSPPHPHTPASSPPPPPICLSRTHLLHHITLAHTHTHTRTPICFQPSAHRLVRAGEGCSAAEFNNYSIFQAHFKNELVTVIQI